ncbi:hypothetical protein L3Q82_001929 [Scortum barcoo]|uniref:Uncharacterized protein n=1 Tax=Scortum barcoo TaxID=214431 RepID=A0ACB8W6N1_9TELE|nr:hypothetical protein L3Q82_001929 [Scortum barcoo]
MFFDFSSAFNTIQSALLNRKLLDMQVDAPLTAWIHNYLTGRSQFCSQSCHLQKFSNDSAIVGCFSRGQEEEYRRKTTSTWVSTLDNKLDWTINTDAIYKKGQSRLLFLRRLRSFNAFQRRTMLQMFYHSVVSSIIFYTAVCWGSRLKTADTNRLNKLIRRAGSVLGVELESVAEVSERRMLRKLLSIMDNVSHTLHATLTSCQSSFSRLRPPRSSTERHRRSFLPT